jgi:putative glutamine amidotransferase
MPHQLIVATHEGSGSTTVEHIFAELGAKLVFLTSVEEAREGLFDRVILLGGTDVAPFWYGQARRGAHKADQERDAVEWALVRRAFTDHIPTLGICRGHQMLAVAAGGSLDQDIREWAVDHEDPGNHELVRVTPELAAHLPTLQVRSYHHQAIETMPSGFRVAARSQDGLIEAIYRPGFVGLQFHPEFLYPAQRGWLSVFQWLLEGLDLRQPKVALRTARQPV